MLRPPTVARTVNQDVSHPETALSRPMGPAHLRPRTVTLLASAFLMAAMATSCASITVKRDTATSGTFTSTGRSFTLLSWDMPRQAIQIAHENASDAGLPNIRADSVSETDWGWFDWILEIIGTRSASVRGTWGFTGE